MTPLYVSGNVVLHTVLSEHFERSTTNCVPPLIRKAPICNDSAKILSQFLNYTINLIPAFILTTMQLRTRLSIEKY